MTGLEQPLRISYRVGARVTVDNADALCGLMSPGDLVLKRRGPDRISRAIALYQQRMGLPDPANEITHVSLYIGDGQLFHATFDPLDRQLSTCRTQAFAEYYLGHDVSLVTEFPAGPEGAQSRRRILDCAKDFVGRRYAIDTIPFLAVTPRIAETLRATLGLDTVAMLNERLADGHLCNTLVLEVFQLALGGGTPVYNRADPPTTPVVTAGYFYLLPTLADVAPRSP